MSTTTSTQLPSTAEFLEAHPPRIGNCDFVEGTDGKTITVPRAMPAIVSSITAATEGWPCRVGDQLFAPRDGAAGVIWLPTADALFGWLGMRTGDVSYWSRAAGCHSRGEVHAALRTEAYEFSSIETLPHVPLISSAYYACPELVPAASARLQELLDFFCPAEPADRDLITAMLATPLAGLPCGQRPAFLITAPDRGFGKTSLGGAVGKLYEGQFDVKPQENIDTLKARLLTTGSLSTRVAMIDNVKSDRWSWADIESLITANTISGRSNFVGERSRPNTLTWIVTANGASMATDMAQRCVTIRLGQRPSVAEWQARLDLLIATHRWEILSGLAHLLNCRARFPLQEPSRWAAWDASVLSHLPRAVAARELIAARQATNDAEADETAIIVNAFQRHLAARGACGELFVTSSDARDWLREALGIAGLTTVAAGRKLGQIADAGGTPIHRNDRHDGDVRGWWWVP